ncbi:LCCL domain containing protein, putative [Babesia bigemina]|uniref:LCCL domain containing protein, putative n=1 Tax=Babesia bigemina TaxID=5866 RepID=A0A061D871_BABBI|nr:LCCL domain containing protein, putative [Babesia bigemina]CDR96876.1 LCCL domain containing protein, putative [Babesia bigemina]|eukprot:XP_012769062.1 LCCL domain containing protein, putative [Babesia bigemina]
MEVLHKAQQWLPLIIAALAHLVCTRNANEFYTFKDATATSVYVTNTDDEQKFGPARAFQIGASYWCSAGSHTSTDFVSWTGELWDLAKVSQIEVIWEYAPKEVEISTSITQDSFNVVMPFRETFESKPSYKEVFKLDLPVEARYVRLTLRGAINEYFGIREIHIVGAGDPMFVIKSGISTTLGEMCLQLEEGRTENNTRVVLDLCTHAIAAADGRDLWRHDSRQRLVSAITSPPKCLTSVSPNKIGALVITECNDEGDEQCRWEFMGNGQLALKNVSDLCMTQAALYEDKAGMGNLLNIMKSKIQIVASSTTDRHGAELAMDGDVKTYWASELFLDSNIHSVNLTINFGESVHAARVRIDWEYQPTTYIIEGSTDNIVFKELARNVSNSDHITIDTLAMKAFKQLRIVMLRPHHSMGKVEGGFVYGIREVEVLTSNMETVLGNCRAAANTPDARDKYFVSYVSEFEPGLAHVIKNMEDEIHNMTGEIMDEMATLNDTLDETDACMQDKKEYDKTLERVHTKETALWKQIQASSLCDKSANTEVMYSTVGETMKNAAEDCYVIKQMMGNPTSGFYWIQPRCSKHPLRVYCDMNSQTSMFIWNGKDAHAAPQSLQSMTSPLAIRYQCAAFGLEPLVVKSKHQLDGLKEALYIMGFEKKTEHYVPLAYKFGNSHKFRDLMNIFSFMTDSAIIETNAPGDKTDEVTQALHTVNHNAAGLSLETGEVEKFDLEAANVEAIVCSTNITDDNVVPIDIKCDDRIDKTEALVANTNTNIVVRCSEHCAERKELPVYGVDGVYSERSSICRAAIHAGVIASRGTFTVAVESGLPFYSGRTENGIQSYAYNKAWQGAKDILDAQMPDDEKEVEHTGPPSKFSIRILPRERLCPIVQTHGSFLQVPNKENEKAGKSEGKGQSTAVEKPVPKEGDKADSKGAPDESEVMDITDLDPNTKTEAAKVLTEMNAMYGMDPKTVVNTVRNIAALVSRAKKYIKPLESITRHQEKQMNTMFDRVEVASQKATHLKEVKESHKTNYERLLHEQQAKGVESEAPITLDYTKMAFSKTFRVYDTSMTSGGESRWGYSDAPFEGHQSYMVQSSDVDSSLLGEGAFAILNNRRYFDFDLKVDVLAKNDGAVGVAFRVQDQFNFYLFVMNSRQSHKQLIKVQDGVALVLATNPDEGYQKNKWIAVDISATSNSVVIKCDDKTILRVLDTSFLHGAVGLYSCGSNGNFYYDHFSVSPKAQVKEDRTSNEARLKTLKCCTYNENFDGKFSSAYTVVTPHHVHATSWRFKDILGGKHKAIHQRHSAQDALDIGSIALLKNARMCRNGHMKFRFLPTCEGGVLGAVVRYADINNMVLVEISWKELRIRHIQAGAAKVLVTVPAAFAVSKWNVMNVAIDDKSISVKVHNNVEHGSFLTSIFKNADFECSAEIGDDSALGFGLGLKASACDSSYFDTLHISPEENNQALPATNLIQQYSAANLWKPCVENVHILSRVGLCRQMYRNKGNAHVCAESFCAPCCSYHTTLLGDVHQQACVAECQKNNHLVHSYLERFLSYVSSCVSLKGVGFDHCEGDRQCLRQACKLCCGSGHRENGPLDKNLMALETSSCLAQCNSLV